MSNKDSLRESNNLLSSAGQTIAAPITPAGQGAVTLIRVSGPQAKEALIKISSKAEQAIKSPRTLVFSQILDGSESLDWGLICFFAAPNSFTGEDCFEVNLHGSPYLQRRALEILAADGVRMARPGEFSERAFLNGRIDLSQAEAVADLVAAETKAQAQIARSQLEGKISVAISDLGEPLRNLLAEVEAHIDFPEEGIEAFTYQGWAGHVNAAIKTLERLIGSFAVGKLYRDGAQVALAGVPNAGKSSLLNCLAGEERAIVTPIPGTTRDSIDVRISLEGLFVSLWDTAGLVEAENSNRVLDEVEKLGIERSWKQIENAELVLFVVDPTHEIAEQKAAFIKVAKAARKILLVVNKIDLMSSAAEVDLARLNAEFSHPAAKETFAISAKSKIGLDKLVSGLAAELVPAQSSEGILISNQRHLEALNSAAEALREALPVLAEKLPPEIFAIHLRQALSALDDIIGVTPNEDILGRIFSRFCIGK